MSRLLRGLLARPAGAQALHEPDYWLITILLTLVMFGTVMVFSASFAIGLEESGGGEYSYLIRQLVWVGIGLLGMLATYRIDYRAWRRFSLVGMLGVIVLLGVVLVPGIGQEVLGARRWIPVGPVSFQPSEIAKPVLIIYLATWLGQKGPKIRQFNYGLVPFTIVLGLMIGLVIVEPDLGSSILLAAIGISMFLVAGAALFHLGLLVGTGSVAFLVMALVSSYRRARILVFLNPDADPSGLGYQLKQATLAFGSGGLFGLGLGASRQKFQWLPFAQSDAIFAVIGEELGLVGCAVVLLLFTALAFRGYRIARRAPDTYGALVAVGLTTWMIFQAAINIGGITLTIPFTGIPLPFISYGGTSLAVSLTSMGILLNISRQTVARGPVEEAAPARAGRSLRLHARQRPRARRAAEATPVRRPRAERAEPRQAGTVRSLDGRSAARSGSFGRGQARRPRDVPRGRR